MPEKRKVVAVKSESTGLLTECQTLLAAKLGETPSESLTITAALTALKAKLTDQMLTFDEARITAESVLIRQCCKQITNAINLLSAAELIEDGHYEVVGNETPPDIRLYLDGKEILPIPFDANSDPVEDFIAAHESRQAALN